MVADERPRSGQTAGRRVDHEVATVDAATVVLARDRPAGDALEVLLLERHLRSDFAGGALVFPGGKVDDRDCALSGERWRGADLDAWAAAMGTDRAGALGLLVAGVRETFEEAGVLLASRGDGTPVSAADLATEDALAMRRRLAVRGEDHDWEPWLAERGFVLELGWLALWSWWVTPKGQHRRFDTRFLVARLPADQSAGYDAVETTDLRWTTPAEALEAQARGEVTVIYPTRRNLAALMAYRDVASLLHAAAAGEVDQRRIEPRIVDVEGMAMVQHPDGGPPEPV